MINQRRVFLGKVFVLLLGVRIGLACISFQRLRTILESFSQQKPSESSHSNSLEEQKVKQIIWAVERSTKFMPGGAKCLAKALTTQVLMERRGLICEFKIGVAKNQQDELEAHAWIERDGQVIMGALPDLDRFKSLPSL